jgi:hypothetical protein
MKFIPIKPMKKFLLFSLISIQLLFFRSAEAQTSFYAANDSFRYDAAIIEPPSDWNMPGFNDLAWKKGIGSIGFGYDPVNLNEQIDKNTKSLYLRYKFNVSNKESIKKVSFLADFDDGYIAYLNGKEILRKNIGFDSLHPAYNDSTIRSHEVEIFRQNMYPVLGYYLDSLLLDSCLVDGENTIAVHVLNDSLNGSDMMYAMGLYDMTHGIYNYYSMVYRYKALYHTDSSNFPLVIINTDEFGIPYKNIKTKAFMGIVDNGSGKYNKPTDPFNGYSGNISIEQRGQSSGDFPKESYKLATIDSSENDSNVSLLGMPSENDWILFGPFADKSQIRNKMIYDLGHRLGEYEPRSRFCELILNGDLVGLYCLTENIKRDKNRVNISKLKETDLTGDDVSGGYIMKWDKNDYGSQTFQIVYPKDDVIKPEQSVYLNSFMHSYNAVLSSNLFMDPTQGFRKYISDSSLVDYIIMNEMCKNSDAYYFSTYLYKDRDDKDGRLKYGPLWDYDLAFGNTKFQQGNLTNGWQFAYPTNGILRITRLFQDETLVHLFRDRWHQLRQGPLHTDSIYALIDTMVSEIKEPVKRNYFVWPVIDEAIFYPNYLAKTYSEEIYDMKNWIGIRLQWIDDNIDNIYYPVYYVPVVEELASVEFDVYPNPFTREIYLSFSSENAGTYRVEMTNLLGQVQFVEDLSVASGSQKYLLDNPRLEELPSGIFILRLMKNGQLIDLRKMIKE